jgi:hypothetical protein
MSVWQILLVLVEVILWLFVVILSVAMVKEWRSPSFRGLRRSDLKQLAIKEAQRILDQEERN